MTNLIHIVGPQGAGKTSLALDIIAGMEQRGKDAALVNSDDLRFGPAKGNCRFVRANPAHQRPDQSPWPDTVIIEHEDLPVDIDAQPGDLVIHMERLS